MLEEFFHLAMISIYLQELNGANKRAGYNVRLKASLLFQGRGVFTVCQVLNFNMISNLSCYLYLLFVFVLLGLSRLTAVK